VAQPRVFDLGEKVRSFQRLLGRVAGETVRLEMAIQSGCWVRADLGQIEQVLVNLVSNAKDAMGDGGGCRIEVGKLNSEPGWVRLAVADDGIGMDDAVQQRAIEPFFTTKPRGKGTGLGLASAHGIVLQSGGRLSFESALGRGTTVRVDLPLVIDAPELMATVAVPEAGSTPDGAILVVDDDDGMRSIVQRILVRAGYEVTVAEDGEAALRVAQARGQAFDLVLTDVIMPGLTGPRLVRRMREQWPDIPALLMSGYPEDALAEVPDLSLARDFLAKPFTRDELVRRVGLALVRSAPAAK
jgi:two-component system cell cycle sensor histidine kinase/response regulator CckA